MNTKERKLKSFSEHNFQVELEHLQKKLAPLVMEQRQLLKKVNAKDLLSFELSMQEKTGWVKASLSAESLGFEVEHYRLTELERILEGKLKDEDVATDGKIKPKKIKAIEDKHKTYYTDSELEQRNKMQEVIDAYNDLDLESKQRLIIDRSNVMQFNQFIRF